jgi:hypothetical protein
MRVHTKCLIATVLVFSSGFVLAQTAHPVSPCVDALEQVAALEIVAPAYKLVGTNSRQYLDDADRPAEIARLQKVVGTSCSNQDSQARQSEQAEAARLYIAGSPECALERDKLSMTEKPSTGEARSNIEEQRKLVAEHCPTVPTENVWLLQKVSQQNGRVAPPAGR